jgi:hypothetical protein
MPTSDSGPPSDPSPKRELRGDGQVPERGLPSVGQARSDRRRMRWFPASFWLWAVTFIGAGIIIWWKVDQGEIEEMKGELLSRQRAVVKELGPRWFPLRERIEKWTTECSVEAFVEKPAPDLIKAWDFRGQPGIYLRLAQSAAKSPKTIREAATKSLRDGFTSCLFTVDNPSPLAGAECFDSANCPDKQLCNEFDHCQEPSQPVNLRLAYKSLHMLSDEWIAEIQEINNKLTARGALATFKASNKFDLPVATDLLVRSKYFLVVVDEAVEVDESEIGSSLPQVDAGKQDDRSIPTAPHPARICMWKLDADGNEKMFAVRTEAAGVLRGATVGAKVGLQTQIAQQRQANSCALALAVRDAVGADKAASVVDDDDSDDAPDEAGSGGAAPVPSGRPAASGAPSATPNATVAPSASAAPPPKDG